MPRHLTDAERAALAVTVAEQLIEQSAMLISGIVERDKLLARLLRVCGGREVAPPDAVIDKGAEMLKASRDALALVKAE